MYGMAEINTEGARGGMWCLTLKMHIIKAHQAFI